MKLEEAHQMLSAAIHIQRELVMKHAELDDQELERVKNAIDLLALSTDPTEQLLASLAKSGFAALAVQQIFECVRSFETMGTTS